MLLHTVPHGWSKQAMMFGFNSESEPLRSALVLFDWMEVAESIYAVSVSHYETKQPREDVKRVSVQKTQEEEYTFPTSSTKNRAIKRKNEYTERSKSNNPDAPSCMIRGAWNSSEEYKVL